MRKHYLNFTIVLSLILLICLGCNFNYSVGIPKEPTSEDLQKLVNATIADFTEALEKDDFEGLRRKTSNAFQQKYKAEEIKTSFGNFATKRQPSFPNPQKCEKSANFTLSKRKENSQLNRPI